MHILTDCHLNKLDYTCLETVSPTLKELPISIILRNQGRGGEGVRKSIQNSHFFNLLPHCTFPPDLTFKKKQRCQKAGLFCAWFAPRLARLRFVIYSSSCSSSTLGAT